MSGGQAMPHADALRTRTREHVRERAARARRGLAVTLGVARAVRLSPARTCRDCGCFPCRCEHRGAGVPDFALRIESCACGGPPIAAGGSAVNVVAKVDAHNATPEHVAWRAAREGKA